MDHLKEYIELNRQMHELKKATKELKKKTDVLEESVMKYMTDEELDFLTMEGAELTRYEKKILKKTSKEEMLSNLSKELKQDKLKIQKIMQNTTNQNTVTEPKLKIKILD